MELNYDWATNAKLHYQIIINKGTLKKALLQEPKSNPSGERGQRRQATFDILNI